MARLPGPRRSEVVLHENRPPNCSPRKGAAAGSIPLFKQYTMPEPDPSEPVAPDPPTPASEESAPAPALPEPAPSESASPPVPSESAPASRPSFVRAVLRGAMTGLRATSYLAGPLGLFDGRGLRYHNSHLCGRSGLRRSAWSHCRRIARRRRVRIEISGHPASVVQFCTPGDRIDGVGQDVVVALRELDER